MHWGLKFILRLYLLKPTSPGCSTFLTHKLLCIWLESIYFNWRINLGVQHWVLLKVSWSTWNLKIFSHNEAIKIWGPLSIQLIFNPHIYIVGNSFLVDEPSSWVKTNAILQISIFLIELVVNINVNHHRGVVTSLWSGRDPCPWIFSLDCLCVIFNHLILLNNLVDIWLFLLLIVSHEKVLDKFWWLLIID